MENNLSLKEKDRIIRMIYKKYLTAQLDLLYINQHYNYYPQIDYFKVKEGQISTQEKNMLHYLERKNELEEYMHKIDLIHNFLSHKTKLFLENEYMNNNPKDWWMDYYSKSSYYRLKHLCIDEFLNALGIHYKELTNLSNQ